MLKVCINGARHAGVPMTPGECAAEAVRCFARGASAVHVHPRGADGRETLDGEAIGATVAAIRAACPELPVGVSTRDGIDPDPARRVEAVRGWPVLPDFASVNVHEAGAEPVAAALHEIGIGVEAGVWTVAAAHAWLGWRVPTRRVLLECMEEAVPDALANASAMLAVIGSQRSVLLHGEGPATWDLLREAVRRGLDTRIGLEDVRTLPDGSTAPDNAAMVAAAVQLGAA
jgi:uncharacterized protein (DUF849 family)